MSEGLSGGFWNRGLGREALEEQRQAGFEERCIKQILRYANVPLRIGQAKAMAREDGNHDSLNFRWFAQAFPSFPVTMGAEKLRRTSGTQIGWTQLFGNGFMKLPFMQEYMKLVNTLAVDVHSERVALVFNAPHADKATTMVLHNQPIQANNVSVVDPERREETETRIIRPYGNPRVTYVLESFNSFMQTVGTDWAADLCR
jgi:hypothetical protein